MANGVATTRTSGATGTGFTINITAVKNTLQWNVDGGAFTSGVEITGGNLGYNGAQYLVDGLSVFFQPNTGYVLNNNWVITSTPIEPFSVKTLDDTEVMKIDNDAKINLNITNINVQGLPTSSAGLSSGDLWINSNVLTIVP